jgi:hypothetical protein
MASIDARMGCYGGHVHDVRAGCAFEGYLDFVEARCVGGCDGYDAAEAGGGGVCDRYIVVGVEVNVNLGMAVLSDFPRYCRNGVCGHEWWFIHLDSSFCLWFEASMEKNSTISACSKVQAEAGLMEAADTPVR